MAFPPNLLLGALRVSIRAAPKAHHSFHTLHSATTSSLLRASPPALRATCSPRSSIIAQLHQRRGLSLGTLFTRAKPTPTPSPAIVANIARIEAEANNAPHDVNKQLALFQALVDTKAKPGYELLVTRWERMCEFDPHSPLIRSDVAFQLYCTSLVNNGFESSIIPAVRRRESLLASAPPQSPPNTTAESSPVVNPVAAPTALPTSRSQEIAQDVLSGNSATSLFSSAQAGGKASPDMAQLATALGGGAGNAGNPIFVTVSDPKGATVFRIVRFVCFTALGGFFLLVVFSVLLENSGLLKAGPKQSEYEPLQGNTVKFDAVHGCDEVKDELQDVVDFLKDPTKFATLGGKLPKGVLLTGPPGTGKTMLARAVAGEAGVPFLFASGSEFEEMFVGVGAKRVRELFIAARKKQPAIIFIDELDAMGGKRNSKDAQYMKQTLNQLLVEMDGFLQSEGVIVIAATNFPEALDPALTRPGRFDRIIAVPLPDVRGRTQILQHYMKDVTTSPEADVTILARGTAGFSGADLQNLVNQAAVEASKQGCREITLKHFEWSKDRIVMGSERKSAYISEKEKLMTAYHEGGHALMSIHTAGAMPLHKVTCMPRGHTLGVTSMLPEGDQLNMTLKQCLAHIDVCMGGRIAEELIYGTDNVSTGATSDLQSATRMATAMVKNYGFSPGMGPVYYTDRDDIISPQTRERIDSEVLSLLKAGQDRTTALLKEKEHELHLLARALVEHETLDASEVRKVIKGEPIRGIGEILKEDVTGVSADVPKGMREVPTPLADSS